MGTCPLCYTSIDSGNHTADTSPCVTPPVLPKRIATGEPQTAINDWVASLKL